MSLGGGVSFLSPCTCCARVRALAARACALPRYSRQVSNNGLPSISKSVHIGRTRVRFSRKAYSSGSFCVSVIGIGLVGPPWYVTPNRLVTVTDTGGAPV